MKGTVGAVWSESLGGCSAVVRNRRSGVCKPCCHGDDRPGCPRGDVQALKIDASGSTTERMYMCGRSHLWNQGERMSIGIPVLHLRDADLHVSPSPHIGLAPARDDCCGWGGWPGRAPGAARGGADRRAARDPLSRSGRASCGGLILDRGGIGSACSGVRPLRHAAARRSPNAGSHHCAPRGGHDGGGEVLSHSRSGRGRSSVYPWASISLRPARRGRPVPHALTTGACPECSNRTLGGGTLLFPSQRHRPVLLAPFLHRD
jgi:hypothetical protein